MLLVNPRIWFCAKISFLIIKIFAELKVAMREKEGQNRKRRLINGIISVFNFSSLFCAAWNLQFIFSSKVVELFSFIQILQLEQQLRQKHFELP